MTTGTRPTRARQLTAVAVLSLLLASLPATAWADHGDRGRGDGGRDSRGQFDRQRERGEPRLRLDAGNARPGPRVGTTRDADHRGRDERRGSDGHEARDRRDRGRDDRLAPSARDDENGFVVAASVQPNGGEGREDQRRSERRAREQAEQARQQRAREREEARARAERAREEAEQRAARERRTARADRRNQLELDRLIRSASTEAGRQGDGLERDLRDRLGTAADGPAAGPSVSPEQPPQQDEAATTAPAPPAPPADAPAVATPVTAQPEPQASAAAPAEADVLVHERGVVDRTFRAGGALLRDTGRAVVSAIPPRTRTFSLPLGLVAALGGYLVLQRRFHPGVLPMSAAAVPDQEGARERHRL